MDCDVEEPNSHIFLKPRIDHIKSANVLMPEVNHDLCDYCGKCASACEYNAIVVLPTQVMVFPELCHGCGLCSMVCPRDAISEEPRKIGVIKKGRSDDSIELIYGLLNIGEIMAAPLIDQVKEEINPKRTVIVDVPSGTACPVIASLTGVDIALVVTEPTMSGLHDLERILDVTRHFGIASVVCINKYDINEANSRRITEFCHERGVKIAKNIPYDPVVTEAMVAAMPVVEFSDCAVSDAIREI